jgi:DNA primase
VEFAVAALGTATTPTHARTLLRHTDRLIFAFDGDNAGRKAAWRALENTLEALQDGKEVSFLFLPEGEDPDSYIRTHGQAAFLQRLDTDTVPLSAFLVRELARGRKLNSQEGRAALIKDAKPLLDKIAAPLLASLIRRQIAELAHLQADELGLMGIRPNIARRAPPRPQRRPAPSLLRNFAYILLMNPQRAVEVEPQWLDTDDPLGGRVSELIVWLREVGPLNPQTLTQTAQGTPLESLVNELMTDFLDKDESWDWNTEFDDAVIKIRGNWRRRREESLRSRPLSSLSDTERSELIRLLARS